MKKIEYAILFYNEKGETLDRLVNVDSLPRIEIGDYLDNYFFNPMCDVGWRAIVVDAYYTFSGEREKPEITLTLRIREETGMEQHERLRKLGVAG